MSNHPLNGSEVASPRTSVVSTTWRPPRTPLSPQRLAKLANALGVSTPIPLSRSLTSRSFLDPLSPTDSLRRSPSPSVASSFNSYQPTTSKFLLHVIPPTYLPHDDDDEDSNRAPAPNAPGYHKQFRRGTLVPVHSTLHAQLGAIAREYALPSSVGLDLYLINASSQSPMPVDIPGPRLSEDIWKHLWSRVLRAERKDDISPLTAGTPNLGYASHSTPFLPQDSTLRPFMTSPSGDPLSHPFAPRPTYPVAATSPSTPSSASDLRFNTKSAPPSTHSRSDAGTPDTSVDGLRTNSLDLPGLNSPSLIPILAKVEFDIDRRKAKWYEPWIRNRQKNHAKRIMKNESQSEESAVAPLELLTVSRSERRKKDPLGLSPEIDNPGYARLTESPVEFEESESEDEDTTATFDITVKEGVDPLVDIFGTDGETWADISAESIASKRKYVNPNVVNLALTGEDLSSLPDLRDLDDDNESTSTKEEEEVLELLERMGNPGLNGRKVPPLPLVINLSTSDLTAAAPPQQRLSKDTDLAYLDGPDESLNKAPIQREGVKREFAVFDDLDLGLDPSEILDDDDPNDRRRSQLLMHQRLDEIERTMAQLSPRALHADIEPDSLKQSPTSPKGRDYLSPRSLTKDPPTSSPPRLPRNQDPPEPSTEDLSGKSWPAVPFSMIKDKVGQVAENPSASSPPRLAVNGVTTSAPKSFAPSRLPVNGLSESEKRRRELEEEHIGMFVPRSESSLEESSPVIPLSPDPFGRYPSSITEPPLPVTVRSSVVLEKEVEQHEMPVQTRTRSGTTSRFSNDSLPGEDPVSKNTGRSAMKSVRSLNLKGFWRRSKDKHASSSAANNDFVPPPTPTLASTTSGKSLPAIPPHRPERPSEEQLDLPDIPENAIPRLSPQLIPHHPQPQPQQLRSSLDHGSGSNSSSGRRTPQDQLMPPPPSRPSLDQLRAPPLSIPMYQGRNPHAGPVSAPMMQASRTGSHLDRLHFDQESPYPTRLTSTPRPLSGRPSSPLPEPEKVAPSTAPAIITTTTTTTAPKSILKHKNGGQQNGHVPSSSTTTMYETPAALHSFERPPGVNNNNAGGRTRRPSVINFGSTTRGTPTNEIIPPNPQVPIQFMPQPPGSAVGLTKASVSFKIVNPTTPSSSSPPPPSVQRQASFDSQGSRPSLDMTQFEFVSAKDIQRY